VIKILITIIVKNHWWRSLSTTIVVENCRLSRIFFYHYIFLCPCRFLPKSFDFPAIYSLSGLHAPFPLPLMTVVIASSSSISASASFSWSRSRPPWAPVPPLHVVVAPFVFAHKCCRWSSSFFADKGRFLLLELHPCTMMEGLLFRAHNRTKRVSHVWALMFRPIPFRPSNHDYPPHHANSGPEWEVVRGHLTLARLNRKIWGAMSPLKDES
jgi:hypothetical protein